MSQQSRAERTATKAAQAALRSHWIIDLAPRVSELPAPIQKYDDPFLPYSRAVLQATGDLAAGYIFDLAAYLAQGAAGAVALERSVAIVSGGPHLTILHGPFASGDYGALAGQYALNVDAATVTDFRVAEAFDAQGIRGIAPSSGEDAEADSFGPAEIRIGGVPFTILRQQFLDQFSREDFAEAMRAAVLALRN